MEENPLDDYALIGVSPISNSGFRVTLINKKKPEDRIMVDSGVTTEGFSIVGIDRKAGDPLGTVVRMKSGSTAGVVKFDEKLLTLAAPPAPQPAVQQPGQNGQNGQQQPQLQAGQNGQGGGRVPRPRVVPPPPTSGAAQQQPVQQQQPARQNNQQRQERRR